MVTELADQIILASVVLVGVKELVDFAVELSCFAEILGQMVIDLFGQRATEKADQTETGGKLRMETELAYYQTHSDWEPMIRRAIAELDRSSALVGWVAENGTSMRVEKQAMTMGTEAI